MKATELHPLLGIDHDGVIIQRLNQLLAVAREHERKIDALDEPNWKQLARSLYVALLGHRADMHGASSRPCPTCHQSAVAIRAYDEATNRSRQVESPP